QRQQQFSAAESADALKLGHVHQSDRGVHYQRSERGGRKCRQHSPGADQNHHHSRQRGDRIHLSLGIHRIGDRCAATTAAHRINPCRAPAARLVTPKAASSVLAWICRPCRAAKARAVSALSENPTTAMPTAGRIRCARSEAATPAKPGTGIPAGPEPTVAMPWADNEDTTTTTEANRHATR